MRCSGCGSESPNTARFCQECGARLARACPGCGHAADPAAKFCPECGGALAPTPAEPRSESPRSFTPRHLTEKILASRDALQGERKQVTVLFADIAGSTELIRDLDPEDAQRLLDGGVQVMMDAVHRYEGTVSRLMGDGLMALFGAPIAHEDHAVRACYAALALQAGMQRYAVDVFARHALRVQARVGLNSGEVVVRLISDDLHMDYTAMGQTVHLASRMEQLAAAGSVVLTDATLSLVEGYVQVQSLGRAPVKGIAEPVEVFELLGAGAARTRLQASAARGLTRFVGRQEELVGVYRALERAQAGHGQVVALVGEPGVGKSRLVWEITRSHRVRDWTVLESGSVSYGKATSWLPVIDLLKAYCRVETQDDHRTLREKVAGKVLMLDRSLEPDLPALLSLLDVPVEDDAWQALDPRLRRRQTLDAVKRLLLRESREGPLLVVFEDLHWVDTETQALLDSLVESLPTSNILLLVNYRPEYTHTWGSKTYYTQLRIDPLAAESAEELLAALLGEDPSVGPLRSLLIERTEGNPLFLEESVRSLVESGALVGARGAYRLSASLPEIRVPATVQAVLAARIDRLSGEDKRLLQTAAVLGKDVPHAILREVVDGDDAALRAGLDRLHAAELLYETALFPELEYTFKHALTHEVAYSSLLSERRRELHARIVRAIERLYPDRLAEHSERLAHHAMLGEAWVTGLRYCREAGARAIGRSASREAIAWLERAIAALERLPPDGALLEQAFDIRLALGTALRPLGEVERSLERLREAEEIAKRLGDRRLQSRVATQVGYGHHTLGEHRAGIEASERGLAIARELGDIRLEAAASHRLGQGYGHVGEHRRSALLFGECISALQGELVGERLDMAAFPAVESRCIQAQSLVELGEVARAATVAREGVALAEDLGHPFTQMIAGLGPASVHLRSGDWLEAAAALERSRAMSLATGVVGNAAMVASFLGYAYVRSGRGAEGLALVEEGAERSAAQRNQTHRAHLSTVRGEAYLVLGQIEAAQREALSALEIAQARGERAYEGWALRLLGEIATRHDPPDVDEAESRYREALTLAEELELRPLQARCHLGLGKLYRRVGRLDEARAELETAIEMLRSMDMTFWLPEAEAELARASSAATTEGG